MTKACIIWIEKDKASLLCEDERRFHVLFAEVYGKKCYRSQEDLLLGVGGFTDGRADSLEQAIRKTAGFFHLEMIETRLFLRTHAEIVVDEIHHETYNILDAVIDCRFDCQKLVWNIKVTPDLRDIGVQEAQSCVFEDRI